MNSVAEQSLLPVSIIKRACVRAWLIGRSNLLGKSRRLLRFARYASLLVRLDLALIYCTGSTTRYDQNESSPTGDSMKPLNRSVR